MERPRVSLLAIVGGSCSGKDTIVDTMVQIAPESFEQLDFDDYFLGKERLAGRVIDDWETPELYRYAEYIKDLEALKRGETIEVECHSRKSAALGRKRVVITPTDWVVVSGFLAAYSDEAAGLFDRQVFVDIPEAEMIKRRLARSTDSEAWSDQDYILRKLIPGYKKYVLLQSERSGVVRLDGTLRPIELAEQVLALMK